MTCFTFCPSLFKCLIIVQRVCLGISPANILYFYQYNPSIIFLSLSPYPVLIISFQCILLCLVPTQMQFISTLFNHSLFLSILCILSSNSPTIGKMSFYICNMIMIVFVYTFLIWIYLPYMRENL
jgi:hypothetical protein